MRGPVEPKQYTSAAYTQVLDDHHVLASVGSVGDAYDNALAESFVDSFKTELIADRVWRTRAQLELAVVEYISWFNHDRLHESLGDIPPVEFEAAHTPQTRYDPSPGSSPIDGAETLLTQTRRINNDLQTQSPPNPVRLIRARHLAPDNAFGASAGAGTAAEGTSRECANDLRRARMGNAARSCVELAQERRDGRRPERRRRASN